MSWKWSDRSIFFRCPSTELVPISYSMSDSSSNTFSVYFQEHSGELFHFLPDYTAKWWIIVMINWSGFCRLEEEKILEKEPWMMKREASWENPFRKKISELRKYLFFAKCIWSMQVLETQVACSCIIVNSYETEVL